MQAAQIFSFFRLITASSLKPALHCRDISAIDPDQLHARGIRGIIFDVDNTLTLHHQRELHPRIKQAFRILCSRFHSAIYSNCDPPRYEELRQMFPLPIVEPGMKKPSVRGFARARELLGLPPEQIAMIGDRTLTDILGGNRAGFYTILVDPFDGPEPEILTRIRNLERWRLRLAGWK